MLRVLCYSKNMKKYVIKIDRTDKKSILQYCRENGIDLCPAPCGGKGTCGKCKVHVTKPYDKVVLACKTEAVNGMEIAPVRDESENMVVLQGDKVSDDTVDEKDRHDDLDRRIVSPKDGIRDRSSDMCGV